MPDSSDSSKLQSFASGIDRLKIDKIKTQIVLERANSRAGSRFASEESEQEFKEAALRETGKLLLMKTERDVASRSR